MSTFAESLNHDTEVLKSRHLSLNLLIKIVGRLDVEIPRWASIHDAIVYFVIGQMLSNAAAESIVNNLLMKLGSSRSVLKWASGNAGKEGPVLGVSQRKRRALSEWLKFTKVHGEVWRGWKYLSSDIVRSEIEQVWGFGGWSADMILIFYLGRNDIWPDSDAALRKIAQLVFSAVDVSAFHKYIDGCETTAALYMWELINRNLVCEFSSRIGNG